MLSISDLKVGTTITYNGAPYQMLKAEHSKTARSAAVLRAKLKNLITGQVLEQTFQPSDQFEPADLSRKPANYQYEDESGYVFMDNETYDQFTLSKEAVGDNANYFKEGDDVTVMSFEGKPMSVEMPAKVDLLVVESPPGIKGDTAGNATKKVKLESGYEVSVPLFINQGDKIRVNTVSGEYVERA
jgi:elongation factor P